MSDIIPGIDEKQLQSDRSLLKKLRRERPALRHVRTGEVSLGQRIADMVAATVGSWPFIITQTVILAIWICANVYGWMKAWDPYPFILLNLMLSFQAAYAAPIIMMSQNRQSDLDRKQASKDYDVNLKAELEIEALHEKIDLIREQEIKRLSDLVEELIRRQST